MAYIGRSTDGFGVRDRFVYVVSGGATSVSGVDANGAVLKFSDGKYVDVYLNGVLLKPTTDYNTNTANTISDISSMAASDEVTVIVYDIFAVADTVSATQGGTFSGDVTLASTDDGATDDPSLILYRNSSSPAIGDDLGELIFRGRNDNSEDVDYAKIWGEIKDETNGTEDGSIWFSVLANGSYSQRIELKGNGKTFFYNADVQLNAGVDLIFEGATANANETLVTVVDPTADRTITLPDATGTVALQNASIDMNGTELILDADGDTSIQADTDDQIDFKVGGNDTAIVTADTVKIRSDNAALVFRRTSSEADIAKIQYVNSNPSLDIGADGKNIRFTNGGSYAETMRVQSNGLVGIGTTPSDKLHVKGGQIQIESNAGDGAYLRIDNDANSGGKIWRAGDGISAHGTFSIYNQTDNTFPFNISLDGVSGGSATNGVARYRNHSSLTLGYGSTVQFTVGQGLINVSNRSYGYGALFMVSYASQVAEVSDPSNQFDIGSGGNILGAGVYKSTNNYTAYVINKDTNGGTRGFSIQVISNDF